MVVCLTEGRPKKSPVCECQVGRQARFALPRQACWFSLPDKRHGLPNRRLTEEPNTEMIDIKQVRQSLLQDQAVVEAIRRRAHQLSLERGYSSPHHMAEDWFRAENEILDKLVEEEITRRQKMNAAISEEAMAEEAVPTVVLPPPDAEPKSQQVAKKASSRRKKADSTTAEPLKATPVTSSATVSLTKEEEVTAVQPKRKRKSSATVTAPDSAIASPDLAPAASSSPSKAAKAVKSKATKQKPA